METRRGSFVRHAAILALAGIISRVMGFALRIPLTNVLGDEGIGIYGDGFAIYNFFLILSSSGLPNAISKLTSERVANGRRDESYRLLKVAVVTAALTGLAAALVLAAGAKTFAEMINNPRAYYALLALSPTVFVVAVMAVLRGWFQGLGTAVPTAVSQLAEQLMNLIGSIALMFAFMSITLPASNPFHGDKIAMGAAGGQLGTLIGALGGLAVVGGLFLFFRPAAAEAAMNASRRAIRLREPSRSIPDTVKAIFFTAIPIIAGTAVFSFSNLIDSTMVKGRLMSAGFTGNEAVALFGVYNGKYVTLTTMPVAISAALATAVIPSLAGSKSISDMKAVRSKVALAIKVSALVAIPAAIGLGVLADPIYRLIFPSAPRGAEMLFYGAPAVVLLSMSQIGTGILQGADRIATPVLSALAGVIVKIPLNYILCGIPSINIYGAIISTTACYLVAGGANIFLSVKLTGTRLDKIDVFAKPLLAGLFMGMAAFVSYWAFYCVIRSNALATLFGIAAGVAAYGFFLLLINGLSYNELSMIPFVKRFATKLKRHGWVE